MIKTHVPYKLETQHGVRQNGDRLHVVSACCGRFLTYEVACKRCKVRCLPADKRMTWGEHISLYAPEENIKVWVEAWTGLVVDVKVVKDA